MWEGEAFEIRRPERQRLPLVVASPHSGDRYPATMLQGTRLSPRELRRSEDFLVQELAGDAPRLGAPLIHARFPRAYVDVNREPYELDPELFEGPLPGYANARSPRVAAGLGTIARVVASGQEIYGRRLPVGEALARIERCYLPYHRALAMLIEETRTRFGFCLLLDCHSMPSLRELPEPASSAHAEMVLGDGHGTTAAGPLLEIAAQSLGANGYRVSFNAPYAGGFVTRHYGRPEQGVHAVQLEIARRLYMDEAALRAHAGLAAVRSAVAGVIAALGRWQPESQTLPRAAE
jgi:N-formylglutamate amidohydrolase